MKRIVLWLGLMMLALLLAACGKTSAVEPTAVLPTELPTEAPEPTAAAVVDYCLDCHTDKDRLVETAKVEEEVETESEGVG